MNFSLPEVPVSYSTEPNLPTVDRWRCVALEFHAVKQLVECGQLRSDFEPRHLAALRRKPTTGAVRGVFSFLLHIYNSENRFDLVEVQRWDEKHIQAFARWAAGQQTGWPCHYF